MSRTAPGGDLALHRRRQAARKRSCRQYPTDWLLTHRACERCGGKLGKYPRHHPDIDANPTYVVFLCDPCHEAEDRRLGKRGLGFAPTSKRPQNGKKIAQAPRKQPDPLPELTPAHVDPAAAPVVVLVGAPRCGKTELRRHLHTENVRSIAYADLEDLTETRTAENMGQWLDLMPTRRAIVEHVGISTAVHDAIAEHAKQHARPVHVVALYCREAEHVRRLSGLPEFERQRAVRIAGLLPWLYPARNGIVWLSTAPPPHTTAARLQSMLGL